MSDVSIQFLLIYPQDKDRVRYYINENTKDTHAIKYEDMYKLICSLITSSDTVKAAEYLRTFQPFIVDVNANTIHKLSYDEETLINEQINKQRKIDFNAVYNLAQQEYTEQKSQDPIQQGSLQTQFGKKLKETIPYQHQVENTIDKYL